MNNQKRGLLPKKCRKKTNRTDSILGRPPSEPAALQPATSFMLQVTRSIQPKLLAQQAFPIVVSTENKLHSSSSRPTSHQAWRLSRSSDRAKLRSYHDCRFDRSICLPTTTHQRTSSAEMEDQASLDGCELKFAQGSGLNDQKEYPGTSQRSYDGGSKKQANSHPGELHPFNLDRPTRIHQPERTYDHRLVRHDCLSRIRPRTLDKQNFEGKTQVMLDRPYISRPARQPARMPCNTRTSALGSNTPYITFPEEIRFEDELYAKRMFEKVVSRSIRVGTTTSCYYSSIHLSAAKILAKVCHQAGQRAFIGKCNPCGNRLVPAQIDRNDAADHYKEASAEESVEDTIQFINFVRKESKLAGRHREKWRLWTLNGPTHPHASVCNFLHRKLLGKLGELMKTDNQLRLQTHLSESLSEIEYTKQLFPACSTYSEVYDSFGLLTERTILAHCIHLEPSELKLLAKRGCGLSHCPTSNFNLRSGICQVQTLLAAGFEKLSLGTDVSGGYGVGILSTIRDAASAAKVLGFTAQTDSGSADNRPQQLSIENLVYLATLGGARVCNLEDRVGNFALGKQFDGLLIQTGAADAKPAPQNRGSTEEDDAHRRFSQWIVASQAEPYLDGSNPNFFIDEQSEEVDLSRLLEKFLFTGDDRNIGSVFINSISVGGSRPLA
ncbi:hypothetical protein PSHT_11432 [Puccinia striiformis]|uniref:Amidohydrolase-related domain-containing protein n=1 Tax=Puccinia striiformis TaxID=27350 RepID=A0A2S4V375_9BASI|nr:hypothetical protein PSHT_11432 [Puccinia striiformis]